MGIDINFGALEQPNPFAAFAKGQEYGIKTRQDQARRQAYNLFSSDPEAAKAALIQSGDLEGADALDKYTTRAAQTKARAKAMAQYGSGDVQGAQSTVVGAGDFDTAEALSKLNKEQIAQANANADKLGGYVTALKSVPYDQRKARLQADAPFLTTLGFKPEQIAAFDPNDGNLATIASHALDTKTAIEQRAKERDYNLNVEKFGEEQRNHHTMEGIAAKNANTSAFSAQTGRLSYDARKEAGGFGTPGTVQPPKGAWESF